MKVEFKKLTDFHEDWSEVYISKKEFIKSFENDPMEAYMIFTQLVEMYTNPHCFEHHVDFETFETIYKNLKSEIDYKGLYLAISENYDFSTNKLGSLNYGLTINLIKAKASK